MAQPQRLPAVNGDDGAWGDILNQYLSKEHYNTGVDNAANGGHKTVSLQAGTATAGTAPLKFTSGPLMTAPEVGSIEFLTDRLYFTQTTSTTRKVIAAFDDTSGATGDLHYRDSTGNFVRLGVGTNTYILTSNGSTPGWSTPPTIPAAGTPALTLGTANGAGVATTFVRTDATLLAFDATVPSTQAFGDAATVGSATTAARRDHKHAMMATPISYATSAEVTTGSSAVKQINPNSLAHSLTFGVKTVHMQIVADATDVDTTSGIAYFNVPQSMTLMNLIRVNAFVTTAGTTNPTTIQVRNMTKYASFDALSTAASVATGTLVGTPGTVNVSYDDVATNDLIKIYVTAQSTTKPKGLRVVLEYQLP